MNLTAEARVSKYETEEGKTSAEVLLIVNYGGVDYGSLHSINEYTIDKLKEEVRESTTQLQHKLNEEENAEFIVNEFTLEGRVIEL